MLDKIPQGVSSNKMLSSQLCLKPLQIQTDEVLECIPGISHLLVIAPAFSFSGGGVRWGGGEHSRVAVQLALGEALCLRVTFLVRAT